MAKNLSLLRYPGGKSRAVELVTTQYIIPNMSKKQKICSPFFGGGSIELYLAKKGYKVSGYDDFGPLVDFWKVLRKNPKKLVRTVEGYKKLSKKGFRDLQAEFRKKSASYTQVKRAAIFYVLNRTSFSGTTLSGGMAVDYDKPARSLDRRLPRFGKSSRDRIRNFSVKNFTVSKMDFRKSILRNKNSLIYADPPYFLENKGSLYGNRGDKMFSKQDHEALALMLNKIKNKKWILSYNDNKYIRKLYSGRRIKTIQWAYGMEKSKRLNRKESRKKKHSSEILILSDAIVMNN